MNFKQNKLTNDELAKINFFNSVFNFEPAKTKAPADAGLWVQYKTAKKEIVTYEYIITNRTTYEEKHVNDIYTITGIVKDLSTRVERDHKSRMIASLCERGLIMDRSKASKEELLIVNYNKALFSDSSKKSIKVLHKHTFHYLFFNEKNITKERVGDILKYGTTVIRITDENPKASIRDLVKGTRSMIEFPESSSADITKKSSINNHVTIMQPSYMTKGWNTIKKDLEKYPDIATQIGKTTAEVEEIANMSLINDTVNMLAGQFAKEYGNKMTMAHDVEVIGQKIIELSKLFASINLTPPPNENKNQTEDNKNDSNKRIKKESN